MIKLHPYQKPRIYISEFLFVEIGANNFIIFDEVHFQSALFNNEEVKSFFKCFEDKIIVIGNKEITIYDDGITIYDKDRWNSYGTLGEISLSNEELNQIFNILRLIYDEPSSN